MFGYALVQIGIYASRKEIQLQRNTGRQAVISAWVVAAFSALAAVLQRASLT